MIPSAERYREIVETLSVHGFGFAVGAAGLAGRFPFRRGLPGHEKDRTYSQPEHLRLALEQLGPTFIKIGQILSTRPDLLPPDYTAELAKLQDGVVPVPTQTILAVVAEELGDAGVFQRFDPTPLATASIGQVHAATLDGQEVIVKVRSPGAAEKVSTDLEILEGLAEQAHRHSEFAREYDLVGITQDFGRTLRNELDYLQEARNAERFATNFAEDPAVHIPTVRWEMTTSRVLTLERITGTKIDDVHALDAASLDRRELAVRASRVLCKMVFEDGFFHADPHPGNFFIEPDGRLGIIDFGMVGELSDELRGHLVVLMLHLVQGDVDGTADAMADLAGNPEDLDKTALRADLRPLVDRFAGLSIADLALPELITQVLALLRRHRLHLPSDLALLFKMLLMAEGLGQRLDPEFQLASVLGPYAERFAGSYLSPDVLARRLAEYAQALLKVGRQAPESLQALATVLQRGGFDVHLRAAELQDLVREADRIGNRVIAGIIAAALIHGVGQIVATNAGRWRAWQGPLVVAGAGTLGALGAYLVRSTGSGRGSRRQRSPAIPTSPVAQRGVNRSA